MKRLLSLVAFFATLQASAQQVNPVPDYVFRNQMSVGRNAVTDTAAYFSIGPRYGATKGFMPPIVGDTATFSSGKRNGLLIFSVQKNKFLYWDSVRVQWSDMAGGSGSYILAGDTASMLSKYLRKSDTTAMLTAYLRKGDTASMLSPYYRSATASAALALKLNISDTSSMLTPYIRHAGYGLTKSGQSFLVDTLNIATRAWRQKGLDSLAALEVSGSGTSNIITKFITASTVGNSQIFDNGTNVGINNTAPESKLHVGNISGNVTTPTAIQLDNTYRTAGDAFDKLKLYLYKSATETYGLGLGGLADLQYWAGSSSTGAHRFFTSQTERLRIFSNGRIGINTTTDAGYQLDINGTLRSVNGANFATTSGNVGIGTASPGAKLEVVGDAYFRSTNRIDINTAQAAGVGLLAGSSISGYSNFSIYSATGTAGQSIDVSYWNGSTYYPAIRVNNVSSGFSSLQLMKDGGNVGIGTASPVNNGANTTTLTINGTSQGILQLQNAGTKYFELYAIGTDTRLENVAGNDLTFRNGSTVNARITSSGELLINTTTDAGDYKLQVVGNARVGTGKLDISSNTTFGIGVARSGTSEIAGQIYNSNGILYLGAESSAGGQIFSGSSAYAGVIGTGALYPLQFAVNNATRATINTNGELLINTTTDNGDFKLQVNGNALISGSIKTANGGSSTAVPWHLGSVVSSSVALNTGQYVEVEINGVFYRLAIVTPL